MKILVPYDGSDASQNALDFAYKMAKRDTSVEVTIISVACTDFVYFSRDFMTNPIAIMESCREFLRSHLEKAEERFSNAGIPVNTILEAGDAAEIIISTVKNQGIDHIVMGRRGLSALRGFLLGSISSKVLANVKVPVTLLSR